MNELKKARKERQDKCEKLKVKRAIDRLLSDGRDVYTSRMKKKDGTPLDVFRIAVLLNLDGKKHLHISRLDISKQVQLENPIRMGDENYHKLLENMWEGYYEVDLKGNLKAANQSFCNISGYSMEELMGVNNRDYMSPGTGRTVYASLANCTGPEKHPRPL